MTPLAVYDFQEWPVRVFDRNEGPWFVAADVCRALEIANPRDAVASLDEDEKGVVSADTLGGAQSLNCVNESGLYSLIFRSRKTAAKAFKRWVTHEVLPTIRQTGRYEVKAGPVLEAPAAALPAPDPEVPWTTLPAFLAVGSHLRAWSLPQQIRFGNQARSAAKAWGIEQRTEFMEGFGRLRSYPIELLQMLAKKFAAPLMAAKWDEAPDFWKLIELLPRSEWFTFQTIVVAARTHGLFKTEIGSAGELTSSQISVFGRLLHRWLGASKIITGGHSLRLIIKGSGRHRRYQVEFDAPASQPKTA